MKPTLLSLLSVLWLALSACTPSAAPTAEAVESSSPLNVVVTTSIVADVVKNIGGERVTVTTLLPIGADVHNYEPAPQDVARVADADLVFVNGAGLEEFLRVLIENAGAANRLIEVSAGIELRDFGTHTEEEGENHDEAGEEHTDGDPHTWTDPNNVKIWAENIRAALTAGPSTAPVAASIPEGTSTASTGAPPSFIATIARE
uniref:Zinc ABC transporter substrate-binding protein n=1 Tax=Bellilinea caldifistulae TaxID=360411 RepID=A0A7C4KYC1_9CHLR